MCSWKTNSLETLIMREDVPPPSTGSNQLKSIIKYSKSCIIWGRVTNVFQKALVIRNKWENKIKIIKSINLSSLKFLRRSTYNLGTSTHYLGVLSLSQHRNQQRRHIFHSYWIQVDVWCKYVNTARVIIG